MNKFFIITNSEKDADFAVTRQIQKYIEQKGGTCQIQKELHHNLKGRYHYTDPAGIEKDVDAILVLGGDGTVIQAANDVVDCQIPILGINLGTLGYLAEIDKENATQAIEHLFDGAYEIEERMMLDGCCVHSSVRPQTALNDIVISRAGQLRGVEYHIYVNDKYLTSYKADGIIVATPTGSTGYSMSAGGAIVVPTAQMILITPICPHTLTRASIVLEADDKVGIQVGTPAPENGQGYEMGAPEAIASFDAAHGIALHAGESVEIKRSSKKVKLVKISKDSFLQVLGRKMSSS